MGEGTCVLLFAVLALFLVQSIPCAGSAKPLLSPQKLRARAISPHVIKLKWKDPGRNKGRATRFYSLRYNAVGEKDSKFVQSVNNRVRVGKLLPNTTYLFSVRTIAGKRGSPWSNRIRVNTPVEEQRVVTKLKAVAVSSHSIRLKWRQPILTNETVAYAILWEEHDHGGKSERTTMVESGSTSFMLDKLMPHRLYSFRVQTMLKEGPGGSTEKVLARPFSDKPSKAPRSVLVQYFNDSYVMVKWRPPTLRHRNGVLKGYKLQYKRKGSRRGDMCSVFIKPQDTKYVLTDTESGQTYKVRVAATTINGTGPYNKWVFIDIPLNNKTHSVDKDDEKKPDKDVHDDQITDVNDIPKAPEKLSADDVRSTAVTISWFQPPTPECCPILGFRIIIQNLNTSEQSGDIVTSPKPTVKIPFLQPDTQYGFNISAFSIAGESEQSDELIIHTLPAVDRDDEKKPDEGMLDDQTTHGNDIPMAPDKLSADDVRSTAVTISWSQPNTSVCCRIVAYRIISRNLNTSEQSREIVTGPRPTVKIPFLQPDTQYGFNISAYSIGGESEQSDELIIHTLPAEPPAILSVHGSSVISGSSVNLSCVARAEPPPEVSWFGPNKTHPYFSARMTNMLILRERGIHIRQLHKSSHDVTSYLILDSVRPQDRGTYTCVAKNIAGSVSMPATLQVHVSPLILESKGTSVVDGEGGQLMCASQGTPLPTIIWLREQTDVVFEEEGDKGGDVMSKVTPASVPFVTSVVEEETSVRHSYLHFPHTSLDHHGNYTCLARSLAGTNETKVLLTVNIPPPPAIQNLQAIALSPSSVSVVWDRPFEYNYTISGYRVSYRKREGGQKRFLDTRSRKQEIKGLQPGQLYIINVIAFNAQNLGDIGRGVMVTTLSNEGLQPANVSAVALNSSMIQLDWASPKNIERLYIRGYNIYYRRENDTQQEMLFIEGNRNKQFLIGLGRDETYYLRIATLTTWGYEAPSQWIRIQKHPHELLPPMAPESVKAVTTMDSIRVSWASSKEPGSKKSPLVGYRMIYGPADAPSEIERIDLGPVTNQFTIRGLNPSQKYIIALRAFNKYAVSEPIYLRAVTKAIPPSTVLKATAVALSPTEIHVYWRPPQRGKVSKYRLRYWRPGKRDKQSAWLEAPVTNYVAGSLKAHSQYRFEIIPFSGDVIGEGSVIFADTLTTEPSAPPTDVVMKTLNASHILVTWKPPPQAQQNGVITSYKLIMKKKGGPRLAKFSVDGARFNYTFANLDPASTYKIRMAAMNINGTGPFTKWIVGHTDKIEMRQPDSPQDMKLEKAATRSLVVTWSSPLDVGVPVMGYIVGFGRYIPEVYRVIVGPRDRRYIIANLKPDTEYIVSIRAFNHIGESVPQFLVIQTLPEIRLEVPIKLKVTPLSPTSMALTWLDPSLKRPSSVFSSSFYYQKPTDGRVYLIRYSAISGENYQFVNATTTSLHVTGLEVATPYEFAVRTTRNGVQSGWSLPVVNTTQHMAPSTAPRKVRVVASPSGSSLFVNWTQPALPNGYIIEYIIYYTVEPSVDTKLWMIKTTKKRSTTINDVMPHTSYYLRVQARNTAGYGPLSDVIIYRPPSDSRAAPSNVTVWNLYGNISTVVEVVWLKPALPMGQMTGYMVYYTADNNQSDASWMIQRERGLSAVILGLTHNTTYHFKVQARYGASLGPFSDTVPFTTPQERLQEAEESSTVTTPPMEEELYTVYASDSPTTEASKPLPGQNVVEGGSDYANLTGDPSHGNISEPVTATTQHDVYPNYTQPINNDAVNMMIRDVQPVDVLEEDVSVNSSTTSAINSTLGMVDGAEELQSAMEETTLTPPI